MIELTQNATFLLHALTVIMMVVGYLLGSYLERRKWVKIFKTAVAFRKGVTDLATTRAIETLGRMGFSSEEAARGLQNLGRGGQTSATSTNGRLLFSDRLLFPD